MSKPSSTNYPNGFLMQVLFLISEICQAIPSATGRIVKILARLRRARIKDQAIFLGRLWKKVLLGGYSSEVPPLPIPNREVKLTNADGTAVFPWESR